MKYWSNTFMTLGAGLIVTAVFTPFALLGVAAGAFFILLGFGCHLLRGEA